MLSPRRLVGSQPRASSSLLPGALLCLLLAAVTASMPAKGKCPAHIDCAREGRHFCRPGTSHCGPCLTPLEETLEGRCEMKKRHHHREKVTSFPALDEEIDYLQAVIAKQQVSKQPSATSSQRDAVRQKNQTQPTTAQPPSTTPQPGTGTGVQGRGGPIAVPQPSNDGLLVIMVSVCILAGTVALIMAGVCWIRLQRESRLTQKVDYPAFGGMPPSGPNSGYMDKNLAQSAQMYHYQHQKQQMLSLGNHKTEQKVHDSEATSDEDEVGGDFTVYECPGLAPTGEMEVKNPLFDDSTLHYQGNNNK